MYHSTEQFSSISPIDRQAHIPIWLVYESGIRIDVNRDKLDFVNHTGLTISVRLKGQKKIKKWQKANPDKHLNSMPIIVYQQKDFKLFGLF